jgi:pimeloyl-ACP methyl ester carboxylesterase
VMIGAHDPLHVAADVERYWRRLLPGARFETIADGGRFLVMSHARRIAELLRAQS